MSRWTHSYGGFWRGLGRKTGLGQGFDAVVRCTVTRGSCGPPRCGTGETTATVTVDDLIAGRQETGATFITVLLGFTWKYIWVRYKTRAKWTPCCFDCLVQDCSNSSALAMELLQSCAKPSIWSPTVLMYLNHWDFQNVIFKLILSIDILGVFRGIIIVSWVP